MGGGNINETVDCIDRKSDVSGKRVDLGGRRLVKK